MEEIKEDINKQEEETNNKCHNAKETQNNDGKDNEKKEEEGEHELPLMALNHVSRLCRSVKDSVHFYAKVLGFVLIERPEAFDFDGAWLFSYGIGIHLVHSKGENEDDMPRIDHLDPMDNHISFQCEDMDAMVEKLKEMDIEYKKRTVGEDDDAKIDQLFLNDPDGYMIEICNCENLKLVPAESCGQIKLPFDRHNPPVELDNTTTTHQDVKA